MNNFFTVLLIPEKTQQVKKIIIPTVYARIAILLGSIAIFFIAFMIYDYVNVIQQLSENKRLQVENRQLKQQMQGFTTKLQNVENALERTQNYTTKLRIITNQAGGENTENLKKKVAPDLPGVPMDDHSEPNHASPPPGKGASTNLSSRYLLASTNIADAFRIAEQQQKQALELSKSTQKRLSDLVREDEEKESAALMEEFRKMNLAFDTVLLHAQNVEIDVQSLSTALIDQKDYLESMPTLRPTSGWYTSGFGVRSSPFTGKKTMHEGLDIANHSGSAVLVPAAGIVTYASARPGYGNLVSIDHGYGIHTQYGHVSRFYVRVGDRVKRGQRIAAVGSTGRSTGPHVHYEVRVNGIPVDPYYYILED